MTIEKAIELLAKDIEEGYYEAESPVEDAARLGTEALKRIKESRLKQWNIFNIVLPGETEE